MIILYDEVDLRTTPAAMLPEYLAAAVERTGALVHRALRQLGGGVVQYRWQLRVRRPGGVRQLVEYAAGQVFPAGAEALELQAIGRPAPDAIPTVVIPA